MARKTGEVSEQTQAESTPETGDGTGSSATAEERELRARVAALEAENRELRALLERREREHVEQLRKIHAALGEAQERLYWLDRLHINLNAVMERPAGERALAAARAVRDATRPVRSLVRRLRSA